MTFSLTSFYLCALISSRTLSSSLVVCDLQLLLHTLAQFHAFLQSTRLYTATQDMRLPLTVLILLVIIPLYRASCPHMMGEAQRKQREAETQRKIQERLAQAETEGSPPGIQPEDDLDSNAPGTLPEEHSIQTTFIHMSRSEDEKSYAALIAQKLRHVRDRLRRDVRVTVDNENIACFGKPDDHFRCADFPLTEPFHFLVVEDSSRGAAVYSVDRDLNGDKPGKVEAAILDALSRHSPHQLTLFASKEAEKEVGFVRELSLEELEYIQSDKKKTKKIPMFHVSPLEANVLETNILEMRQSADLDVPDHKLTNVPSEEVFDEILKRYKHVFVLFWTTARSSSAHAFHLFAQMSKEFEKTEDVQLAMVECHTVDFCVGLNYKDFHSVIAYENGVKVAAQEMLLDVQFYKEWIQRILAGSLIELQTEEEIKMAKKGNLLHGTHSSVVIGTFPSIEDSAYLHYKKIADKFVGRYYLAYVIKKGASPTLITYRPEEKKRRVDYTGRFDPATIASFITYSTFPTVTDISGGFSTDLLFYQPLPIVLLIAPSDYEDTNYKSLAAKNDLANKKYLFTRVFSDTCSVLDELLKPLSLKKLDPAVLVVFHKHKVSHLEVTSSNSDEELLEWIKHTETAEPDFLITYNEVHPLMNLQLARTNKLFGHQPVTLAPDLSIFADRQKAPLLPNHPPASASSGGCPFMHGGGAPAESHDEL